MVANYAYQGALVFYNALMPVVADPEKIGKVSGYGVGMGYVGSIVGLLMVMPFVQGNISFFNLNFSSLQKPWQPLKQHSLATTNFSFLDSTVTANDNYQYQLLLDGENDSPAILTSSTGAILIRS